MQIKQTNNITFKRIFMPGYPHYTDAQKEIANKIYKQTEQCNENIFSKNKRKDLLITRMGSKDSLYVYNCNRDFNYKTLSSSYENKLYVGKYNTERPFCINDVIKARKNKTLNIIKALAFTIKKMK